MEYNEMAAQHPQSNPLLPSLPRRSTRRRVNRFSNLDRDDGANAGNRNVARRRFTMQYLLFMLAFVGRIRQILMRKLAT